MSLLLTLALGGVTAVLGAVGAVAEPMVAPLYAAHRGGALLWPENSMLAFRNALAMGADFLELDVHLSRDGEVRLPKGFRASGVTAGLKASGRPDLALVVNDGPDHHAAAVFTSNRVEAAPVPLPDGRPNLGGWIFGSLMSGAYSRTVGFGTRMRLCAFDGFSGFACSGILPGSATFSRRNFETKESFHKIRSTVFLRSDELPGVRRARFFNIFSLLKRQRCVMMPGCASAFFTHKKTS